VTERSGSTFRRVFIDTSAFYALADPHDQSHQAAVRILDRLISERRRLFTTNFVVAETHALILRRRGRIRAARFLDESDKSHIDLVRVSAADERRARTIIDRFVDKDFSLTDLMSFAVMERLHIPVAFRLDSDFAQFGLSLLVADG
jgi:predicted nucleic acid-binding protein